MLRVAPKILMLAAAFAFISGLRGQEAPKTPAAKGIDFSRDIRPILSEKCFACHGPDEQARKAKLRFDTQEGAFAKLRRGGFAIVPGKPAQSELVARVNAHETSEVMPPPKSNKRLTPSEKQLLSKWIADGASWSSHWAFVVPKSSPVPAVTDPAWARNPIDAFILERLHKEGLAHSAEASRTALIRRVSFDLTGLPPTPEEVDLYLKDSSPDAYEKLVDRLLNSPRYGEHMARYWLDAARYADTHGLHLDAYREMWPYREWVIGAFNRNLPFDRFIVEQLAGDLLPNPTLDQQIATGFIRCHVTTSEGGSIEEEVYVRNVVDCVDTAGTVFLGLSVGCARCHDHRYDPVRMKDYYQLFAFFNNIDGRPLDGNAAQHPPVVRVPSPEQARRSAELDAKLAPLQKKITDAVAAAQYDETEIESPKGGPYHTLAAWLRDQKAVSGKGLPKALEDAVKADPAKRSATQKKQLRDYFMEHAYSKTREVFAPLHAQFNPLKAERDKLDKEIPTTLVFKERSDQRPSYILKRGEYDQRGDQVGRDTPASLPPLAATSPRNRLGLAQWLVSPDNPLTARVAVNRLWQQVFGIGLVKTAEDFGSQGEPPSHPELLDWLATQFVADGWDVKRLMKRMVTSAAYRQTPRATPDRLAKDAENRLLSRGPRYRLEAEMVRDQALFISGLLVDRIGGPSVKPPQPKGLWEAVGYTSSNTAKFNPDSGHDKVHRRSMYTFWKRTSPPPQMNALDAPSREACIVRRERTNTPLQALLLMNETQFVECARALAERAMKHGDTDARLKQLFKLATARSPEPAEMSVLVGVYNDHLAAFTRQPESARALIAIGETRSDSRLPANELAATTMVANLVLNLDEVLNK